MPHTHTHTQHAASLAIGHFLLCFFLICVAAKWLLAAPGNDTRCLASLSIIAAERRQQLERGIYAVSSSVSLPAQIPVDVEVKEA
jgi:hypothetical protein